MATSYFYLYEGGVHVVEISTCLTLHTPFCFICMQYIARYFYFSLSRYPYFRSNAVECVKCGADNEEEKSWSVKVVPV